MPNGSVSLNGHTSSVSFSTADRYQFVHNISFLVPPFDPDYINWPSYVEKLNRHYDAQVRPVSLHLRTAPRFCFLSDIGHLTHPISAAKLNVLAHLFCFIQRCCNNII